MDCICRCCSAKQPCATCLMCNNSCSCGCWGCMLPSMLSYSVQGTALLAQLQFPKPAPTQESR
jgi:hypothetical protein